MGDVKVPLSRLLLDEQNPRHRPVTTQEDALREVVRLGASKLLNLARDIAANGLSPIDRLIVMKLEGTNKFIVLEGNRRLAALRLLDKPQNCPEGKLVSKFIDASTTAAYKPRSVRCYEVTDREEARPLLERRHAGEMNGIGIVRWSALQRTRNSSNPGHQERMALAAIDWLDAKSQAGSNQQLTDLLNAVAEDKFTTFGRLTGDPDFRIYCGFEIQGDILTVTDTTEMVVARLVLVLQDFAAEKPLTVSQLKSKEQRTAYIVTLRERMAGADDIDEDGGSPQDSTDEDSGSYDGQGSDGVSGDATSSDDDDDDQGSDGSGADEDEEVEEEDRPPPMKLFVGASLSHCRTRVRGILNEVQKLPIQRYPNSAAACIRMIIELAVHEAHEVCKWPAPQEKDAKLRHYVGNAVKQLDPSGKASRYLAIRQELNKKDSLINTVTLNAFLHDPHYIPSAPNMRTISDTYCVLLNDLNKAIGEVKDAP